MEGVKRMSLTSQTPRITLYHGSRYADIIPTYGVGREDNDYGQGFYLTPSESLASEWAVSQEKDGYIYEYSLDLTGLKVYNFEEQKKQKVLYWITTLLQHRTLEEDTLFGYESGIDFLIKNFSIDVDKYDLIIGWRADDSYFSYAKAFIQNRLEYTLLEGCMRLADLGLQYCCKFQKAFTQLGSHISRKSVTAAQFYDKFRERDVSARKTLFEILRSPANHPAKSLRLQDIMSLYRR